MFEVKHQADLASFTWNLKMAITSNRGRFQKRRKKPT